MQITISKHFLAVALSGLLLPFVPVGCGGGGGGDSNPNPKGPQTPAIPEGGSLSVDETTGVATFESNAVELQPGVLYSRMAVLAATGPAGGAERYSATSILKFSNTSGVTQQGTLIVEIHKSVAENVDQLQYKVVHGVAGDSTVADVLEDSTPFVNVNDFVNQGSARVVEEDPIFSIPFLIAAGIGTAAIPSSWVFFNRPDLVGLTPRSHPRDLKDLTTAQIQQWSNDRLLGKYCSAVRTSAAKSNIPPHLLATIILNEIADYGWEDTLQEIVYTGEQRSHGWVQLQTKRLREHGLVDVGPRDRIRDPSVDIDEAELVYTTAGQPGEPAVTLRRSVNEVLWQRLLNPESAIEFAAREIAFLLDKLKPGSAALNNPWAKALLINPTEGVNKEDPFANLKVTGAPATAKDRQVALDRTLAVLIAAAYNGGGAIFNATSDAGIFTADELTQRSKLGDDGLVRNGIPWETLGDIDVKDPKTNEYLYAFRDPRLHAQNAGVFFPKALATIACLEETPEPGPAPTFDASACPASLVATFVRGDSTPITLPFKNFQDDWFMNEASCYYSQTEFPIPNPGWNPAVGFDAGLWFEYDGNYDGLKPGDVCAGQRSSDDVTVTKNPTDQTGAGMVVVSSNARNVSVRAFYVDSVYRYDYTQLVSGMTSLVQKAVEARIGTCK